MKRFLCQGLMALAFVLVCSCSGSKTEVVPTPQDGDVLTLKESEVEDFDKYYKPQEFDFDMLRSDSKWSWCRSAQSEHFVVFWDIKYGEYGLYGGRMGQENTWPTNCSNSSMSVDIKDLLEKAEIFYDLNVNKLGFADTGKGNSMLDRYKMQIYILYQDEWLATGAGYDNTVGALWVNPSTCQPVGSTIGHEIGHCFQYLTFCDYLLRSGKTGNDVLYADGNQGPGWRYGFGTDGDGGNCFWEQTAQWQSMQLEEYRPEAFRGWYEEFTTSTYLHVLHERPRYANYFIHWWWTQQNDIKFIGRLWNESVYPEDPVETYMRLMKYDVAGMNDSMWEYAAHIVTYDIDDIRSYGMAHVGDVAISDIGQDGEWWAVDASKAPETTGSNAIGMTFSRGEDVSVILSGNLGIDGCVSGSASVAGWRYGFVTYNSDGTSSYSPVWRDTDVIQTWTVPSNAIQLWFVVTGAPSVYERHPWTDESDTNDTKWPWKARFTGTAPRGK